MKSPGMMLKEAREERGLTLSDVAAMTRIPKTMLAHLEADRFEEYVAEVFVRGHLRNYARELRLDSELVMQAYERHTGRRRVDPLLETKNRSVTPAAARALQPAAAAGPSPSTGAVKSASPRKSSSARSSGMSMSLLRPSHFVAAVLVLLGIIVMFSFLSSNRATAQDPTSFPEVDASAWELEQDIQETRWLLEQSDRRE